MNDRMSPKSQDVIRQLIAAGYRAYYVGGCVRDAWLGRPIQDMDIATSATPEQVMACFPKTVPTGLKHGTVLVLHGSESFEVTTFRIEMNYTDFRRPTEVRFTADLLEDLKRRDFTMNAMAMDIEGNVIDPFGGQLDFQNQLIRCVGNPAERFQEDALRMLRCLRFAATYRLEIEQDTWHALCLHAHLLKHIAMERVKMELTRIVASADVARAIQLLCASQLFRHFKRPWKLPVERWLAHEATLQDLSALREQHQRWVLLMLLLAVPAQDVRQALQALTFSRDELSAVVLVIGLHDDLADSQRTGLATPQAQSSPENPELAAEHALLAQSHLRDLDAIAQIWKLAAVRHGIAVARDYLAVIRILNPKQVEIPFYEMLIGSQWGERWLDEIPCSHLQQLDITGEDLIQAIQKPAGAWVRTTLHQLLEDVALGEVPNEYRSLLVRARRILSEGV